mmetsp:Transcript_56860/g.146366  ORF Transcript_56860/g.146366 Transcript_56860/m.146366 type:complete len:206 (-) Transcript_56860:370-987(-)
MTGKKNPFRPALNFSEEWFVSQRGQEIAATKSTQATSTTGAHRFLKGMSMRSAFCAQRMETFWMVLLQSLGSGSSGGDSQMEMRMWTGSELFTWYAWIAVPARASRGSSIVWLSLTPCCDIMEPAWAVVPSEACGCFDARPPEPMSTKILPGQMFTTVKAGKMTKLMISTPYGSCITLAAIRKYIAVGPSPHLRKRHSRFGISRG